MHKRLETYAPVETYLQQVSVHLAKLPPALRDEELRELRQHLLALVQAGQDLGESEDEALTATLRQFGAPQRVGSDLVRAWKRRCNKELLLATGYGYATWIGLWLVMWVSLFVVTGFLQASFETDWRQNMGFFFVMGYSFLVTPFVSGWSAGVVAPRQGGRAVILMAVLNVALVLTQLLPEFGLTMISAIAAMLLLLSTLAAGLPGAWCGGRWKLRNTPSDSASGDIMLPS